MSTLAGPFSSVWMRTYLRHGAEAARTPRSLAAHQGRAAEPGGAGYGPARSRSGEPAREASGCARSRTRARPDVAPAWQLRRT